MKHTKNNRREAIIIEVGAWLFILGIFYILTKVILQL